MGPSQIPAVEFQACSLAGSTRSGQDVLSGQEAEGYLAGAHQEPFLAKLIDEDIAPDTYMVFRLNRQNGEVWVEIVDLDSGKILRVEPLATIIDRLGCVDMLRGMLLDMEA